MDRRVCNELPGERDDVYPICDDLLGFMAHKNPGGIRTNQWLMRNIRSEDVSNGQDDGEEGKRHLQLHEYIRLGSSLLSQCDEKFCTKILRGLLLLCNLCAPTDTVSNIHALLLDWKSDAFDLSLGLLESHLETTASVLALYW
jgi:hypothetical protein